MTPATAALAAGTVTGVLASAPIVIAPVVAAAAAKRAGKKVADILLAFGLRRMRKMSKQQSTMLFTRHPTLLKADLQRALKFEEHLEQVFQDRMRERVARDVEQAFLITDPGERHARIQFIMERERRFARMREQAMTDRLEGAATVGLLKQTSPHGALWVLSERVKTHTPDCVALAGHIWPWELLELLHPPVHFGCACYLLSTDSAVKSGLASEWDIPKTAEQRAAKIRQGVRLYKTNVHDGHDHSNLDELAEAHVPNLPDLPGEREILRYKKGLAKGGQFAPKRGGSSASARGREKTARSASKLAQRGDGRWHQIEGRSVFVPRGRDFRRRVNGKDYTSPEGTTSLLVDGKKVVSPADPVQATGTLDLPTVSITRDRARQLADAVGALRDRREPRGTHPLGKELSTTSPDSFADYQAESFALAAHLSEKFGTPTNISKVGTDESEDHAGFTGWNGDVVVGREVIPGIEEDSRLRHSGLPLAYNDLRRSFGHYKVQAHEVSHTVNPTTRREYRDPVGFQLEESLTEEACHVIAIENLARHGRADVIGWYRSNPLDDKVQGSYMQARARLLATLNAIGVNPEEREEVVMDLKFRVRPADRLARLAELSEENDSKHSQAEIRALLTAPVENDTPSRVLVPHYQDVPAKKPTTKSLGVDISEGSRIRFTAPHRPERTGKVVNVVDQNPKQQTLWVQDDFTGEVYPNVSPSHVTAVLSAAGFRNFKDDGNTYREGDAIEYQVDGSWKPAVVTQVIASDQQSWTCEAVDAQGHAMILTGGSVQAIRPVIVDGTPKTRVKARTKRSRPQVGVTGRADKPTPQDQPSPTVDEEALNPAVWAAQPTPGTPPKIVTLNVANSPKLSKPSSPPATKLKLENAVREKREAPSTPDIYADTQRIEASTIAIRTDGRGLAGILESGRVKNWHETDTTTGHFTPQLRAYLEASAFDLPWNPDLQPPEAPAASIYRDAAAAAFKKPWAFPIHGYLDGTGPDPQQHGPFKIKLKGETKARTTYTATDLFDSTYEQSAAPSPVNNPDPHLSGLLRGDKAAEAQIHGPVTLNDIASIEVPADISKPLSDALDKSGIPWSITNEPEGAGVDRRRAPSSGKGRKVPAYKMPLREFEGYAWNDPTGPHRRRDPGTSDSKLDQMLNLHVGMRDGRKPTGWKYGSTEELVLAEGRNWEPQPLPKDAEPWRGEPQECYSNAAKAVLGMSGLFAHPDWRYVEGYALAKDIPFPVAHAWAVDQDDRVIELTWPDAGLEYRGIEFDHDRLRGILLKREMFGVLDDWQNEYPLLQHGASEGRQDPGSPESATPTSPESATPRTVRMWHLTDRADFKLDPDFAPFVNTTIGDMGAERKGLYVAPSAEAWFNGYDYVRPFVAEIEVPELPSFGGYSGENFLPADRFGDAKVLRVIPTDEYARETYLGKGWFEEWQNPRKWDEPVQRLPEDYRYEGPDVRDMKPEQVEALRKLTADYIEANRPWINAPEDADGMYDPGVAVDAPRTIPPKPDILDYPDIMDGIQAKRDWTQMLTREVSRGTVDEREAVERGWDPPRRPREGQDRSFQPLPETLYHATTARDAVRREGLRTREDLGVGGSLGGGEPDAISLTTDLDVADSVVIALDEVRALMSGEITFKDLLERADKGDLGSKPFGAELRKALFRQGSGGERYWTEIIDNNAKVVRRGVLGDIERTRDPATAENWAKYGLTPQGEPDERGWYEYGTRPLSHEPVLNERGWYDQSEFADAVNGFHRVFRSHRQEAGGPEDPMLYLTDYDALGKVPADQIVVLEVQPDPKARGYAMYGMEEWRTHSGDALKVTADLTHEELWDKDEGRADPGTVTRPEIPPKPASTDYPAIKGWEATMERAICAGEISLEDAEAAGYDAPYRRQSAMEPLPNELWHVTTARSKVRQRGLLTRLELGSHVGLGGGDDDTVSVTHNPVRANDIRRGLLEIHDLGNGKLTFEELMRRADAGEDADRPWGDDVRRLLWGGVGGLEDPNLNDKLKWEQRFKGREVEWGAGNQHTTRPLGDVVRRGNSERMLVVAEFMKTYLWQRERAGGPFDPIVLTNNGAFDRLKNLDPEEIVVLGVTPEDGAMGWRMDGEDEYRTASGRGLRVIGDETNHERWPGTSASAEYVGLDALDVPDRVKAIKSLEDLAGLWAEPKDHGIQMLSEEEREAARREIHAATQRSLQARHLNEFVLVWPTEQYPGPGPTRFSLSPTGSITTVQPSVIPREEIVVDGNAFFAPRFLGENEVVVAVGNRAQFANADMLKSLEGRLDPGTPDFTIPTPEGMRDLGTALGRLLKPRRIDPVTITSHQGLETEIRQGPQYRVQLYRAVGDGELLDVSWYGKKSERGNPILATPAGYEVELTSGTNSNVKFIREIDPNSPWELMGRVHPELQGELRGMIRTFEDGDYTGTVDEADRIIEENSQTDMVARVQLRLVAQEMRKRSLQELNGTPLTIPADWDQPKVPIEEFRTRAADFRSLTDAAADRTLWTGDFDLSATDLKRRDLMADKPITVFRALPVGRDDSLLPGDYVTESESYARMYGDDQLGGRYRIENLTLKPSDLEWLGDPQEFRFQPADSREAHAAAVRVASINGREIPENVLAERPPTLPGPSDPGTPVEGRSYFQAAIGDNGTWFETFAEANDALKRTEKLITDMDLEEQVVLAPQDLGRMFDEPPTADELATFGLVPGAASPLERDDGAVGFATATRNKARREVARDLLAVNGAQPLATRDTDLLVSAKIWQLSLKEGVPGAGAISESGVDGFTSKDMVIVRENGIAVPGRSSHLATIPTRTDPVTRHEIAVAAGFKDQKDAARELYALDQVREDFRDLTVEEAVEIRKVERERIAGASPTPVEPGWWTGSEWAVPAGTMMYHVAPTRLRKLIEAEGLDPNGPLLNAEAGHDRGVYLWADSDTAWKYRGQGPNAHIPMDVWEVDVGGTTLGRDQWLLYEHPEYAAAFPGAWVDANAVPATRVKLRTPDPWFDDEHPHEDWGRPTTKPSTTPKATNTKVETDPVKRMKARRRIEELSTVIGLLDQGGGKLRSDQIPEHLQAKLKMIWMPERYHLRRDANRQFIWDRVFGKIISAPQGTQEGKALTEALNVGWRGPDGTKRRDPGTRVAAPRIFRPVDATSLRPGYDTPLELFHVTTNGPEVRANGIIRAQDGGGLGGRAQENTVALSVSRQEAESLAADLRFVGNMYRDGQRADVVEAGLVDRENEGVSLNPGFANLDEFGPKINPEHVEVIEVSARDLANGAHLAAEDDLLLHHGDLKLSPERAAGPRVNPNPERWVNVPTSNLVAVARGESRGGRRTAHAILATRDPQEVLDAISADLENATEMGEEKVGHLTRLQTETAIRAGMSPTERLSLTSEAEVGQPDTLVGRLNAARMNEIERVVQAEGGTIRQGRLNGQDVQIIQTGDQLLRRDPGTGDVADIATTEALAAIDAARPRPAIRSPGMDRRPYDYLPRVQKMEQHTARLVGNSRSADEGERPRLKEMLDKVRRGEQPLNAGDTARDIELLLESGGFEVLEGPVNPEVLNTGKLRIGLRTGAAADLELKDGEIQNTTWTPGWRGTGDEVTLESLATPAGWREALFQRAAAMADTWGRGEVLTNLGSAAAQNLGGSYDMSGVIDLRPSLLRPLNRAAFLQASGQPVDRDTALAAFSALEIVQHEIGHGVNPISLGDYNGWRKTLLEAVQEETAPTLAIEWAKELGLTSILGHVQNEVGYEPVNPYIAGSYLAYREALRGILEFGTPYDGDHYELFQELKYAHTIDEALDRLSEVTGIDREELVNRLEDPPELLNNIAFKPIIEVNPNVDPAPSGEADEARPNNRRDIFFKKGDLVYADGVLATVLGEHPGVVVVQTADGEAAFKMEHVSRVGSLVADFSWVGDWSGKEGEVIVGSRKSDAPLESSVITAAPGRRVGDPPLDWGDAGPSVGLTRISRLPEGALVISPSGGDVYARGAMVLTRNDWGEGPPFLEPYQFSVRGMGIPESSYVEDTGERVVRFRDLEVGDRYIDNSDSGIVRTVTKTVEDGKLGYAESSLDNLAPEQRTAAEVTMVGMEWVDVLGQPVNVGSIQQGRFMAPDENGFQRVWRTLGRDWFQAGSQAEGQVAARRLSNLDGEAGEVKAFSPDDLVSPLGGGLGDGRRDPGTTEKARWVAGEFVNSNDLNDGDRIVFQWDRMSGEAIIREVRWGVNSLESLNENGDWRPLAADVYPRAIREDDEDGLEGLVPISSLPVGTQFWFGSEQDAVVSRQMIGVRGEDVTRYIVRRRLGGPPVNQSEDHPVNGNTLVRPWDREKVPTIDQLPEEASFKVGAFGYRVAGPATDGGYIPTIDQHGRLQLTRGDLLALDVPEDLDVSVPTEVSIPGESEIVPIENVPTGGLFQRPNENDLKVRLNLGVDDREGFASWRSVVDSGLRSLADSNGTTVRYYPNLVSLRESPVEIRELEIGDRFWNGDMGLVKLTADGYAEPLGTDGVRAVGIYNTVKFVDRAVSDRIMAEVVGVNLGTRVSDVQDGQRFKLTEDGPLIEVVNARSGEALHPEFGTIRLTEEDRRRYVQSASRAVAASVGSHDRFIPTNTNDPNEDGDHRISYYDLKPGDEFLLVGDFGENAAPYYRRTDDGFVRIDPEFGEIDPPDRVVDLIAQNGGTIRRIAIDAQRRIGMQRHERMAKIKAAREEEFWTELNESDGITLRELEYDDRVFLVDGDEGHWWTVQNWHHQKSTEPSAGMGVRRLEREDEDGNTIGKVLPIWTDVEWVEDDTYERLKDGGYLEDLDDPFRDSRYEDVDYGIAQEAFRALAESGGAYDYASWSTSDEYGNSLSVEGSGDSWEVNDTLDGYQSFGDPVDACNYIEGRLGEMEEEAQQRDVDGDEFQAIFDGFEHNGLHINMGYPENNYDGGVEISGSIIDEDGNSVGTINRTLSRDGNELKVYHALMQLDRDQQGKGFATALMEHQIRSYQQAGYDRVEVGAGMNIGGYAWARLGFDCSSAALRNMAAGSDAENAVRDGIQQGVITEDDLEELRAKVEDGEIDNAFDFAGYGSDNPWIRERTLAHTIRPSLDPAHADEWDLIVNIDDEERYERYSSEDAATEALMQYQREAGTPMWIGKSLMLGRTWSGTIDLHSDKPIKRIRQAALDQEKIRKKFKENVQGLRSDRNQMRLFDDLGEKKPLVRPEEPTLGDRDLSTSVPVGSLGNLDTFVALPGTEIPGRGPYTVSLPVYGGTRTYRDATGATITQNEIRGTLEVRPTGATYTRFRQQAVNGGYADVRQEELLPDPSAASESRYPAAKSSIDSYPYLVTVSDLSVGDKFRFQSHNDDDVREVTEVRPDGVSFKRPDSDEIEVMPADEGFRVRPLGDTITRFVDLSLTDTKLNDVKEGEQFWFPGHEEEVYRSIQSGGGTYEAASQASDREGILHSWPAEDDSVVRLYRRVPPSYLRGEATTLSEVRPGRRFWFEDEPLDEHAPYWLKLNGEGYIDSLGNALTEPPAPEAKVVAAPERPQPDNMPVRSTMGEMLATQPFVFLDPERDEQMVPPFTLGGYADPSTLGRQSFVDRDANWDNADYREPVWAEEVTPEAVATNLSELAPLAAVPRYNQFRFQDESLNENAPFSVAATATPLGRRVIFIDKDGNEQTESMYAPVFTKIGIPGYVPAASHEQGAAAEKIRQAKELGESVQINGWWVRNRGENQWVVDRPGFENGSWDSPELAAEVALEEPVGPTEEDADVVERIREKGAAGTVVNGWPVSYSYSSYRIQSEPGIYDGRWGTPEAVAAEALGREQGWYLYEERDRAHESGMTGQEEAGGAFQHLVALETVKPGDQFRFQSSELNGSAPYTSLSPAEYKDVRGRVWPINPSGADNGRFRVWSTGEGVENPDEMEVTKDRIRVGDVFKFPNAEPAGRYRLVREEIADNGSKVWHTERIGGRSEFVYSELPERVIVVGEATTRITLEDLASLGN